MVEIRSMTLDDLPLIDEVQHASFVEELWEDMSLFKSILEHYERSSFVAHKDGKLLGYLITHPSKMERNNFEEGCEELDGSETCLYVHDLCVHPDGRGLGIANVLLRQLDDFAKENNFSKYIGVAVQDAESFWTKQGYKPVRPYPYNGEPGTFMVKDII